jgi:hypothetical protein
MGRVTDLSSFSDILEFPDEPTAARQESAISRFTGQALLDLLCMKSLRVMASEIGVSVATLRKVATCTDLPIPSIGHWMRPAVARSRWLRWRCHPREFGAADNIEFGFNELSYAAQKRLPAPAGAAGVRRSSTQHLPKAGSGRARKRSKRYRDVSPNRQLDHVPTGLRQAQLVK